MKRNNGITKMIKEIVPGLYVSSDYLKKIDISIQSIDINSGLYVITVDNQQIIYFHDIDIVVRFQFDSFTKKHGINGIRELVVFFQNMYLPDLLIEDDVEVFSDGGILLFDEVSKLDKYHFQLQYRDNSYTRIENLVKRGAKTWYKYFFDHCFFHHHNDSIYLTDNGFVVENADNVFKANFRTIQNNLKKLKQANIIDYEIRKRIIKKLKFNAKYLPAIPSYTPIIFKAAVFNLMNSNSTFVNLDFEPINKSLKPIVNIQRKEFELEKKNIDIEEKRKQQKSIGEKSEKIAFEFEKKRLLSLGHTNPNNLVEIVSENPELGYDILSYESEGKNRYIEVKTVKTFNTNKRFYISRNELEKSKELSNYYLYLVSYLKGKPTVSILKCEDIDKSKKFLFIPIEYEVIIDY